ncbi:MAG: hypothetical protein HQM13_05000 [SAR324 cluster bacterium]|nr:hypothetical protein [SAR324 cluster bacterium]
MDFPPLPLPQLTCPQCASKTVSLIPLQGKEESWFAGITCQACGEQAFFQIEAPNLDQADYPDSSEWSHSTFLKLQSEWQEWLVFKRRHLRQAPYVPRQSIKVSLFLLIVISLGAVFFLVDQYHLLGVVLEDRVSRQQEINQYVSKLSELPCFSSDMLKQIRTVPVHYTPESVYDHNQIQYGETGQYWGKLQIKIHRSNFWFFGWPKKSQLINTLIHEFRHRANPWLGHDARFYERVNADTQCALKHWK